MPDKKISQLDVASELTGTELLPVVQNGVTKQTITGAIAPYLESRQVVPGSTGIMIPYYVYPNNPYTDATFRSMLSAIRTYRDVPVMVVLNPGSGPGTVWDGNYAAAIRLLKAAGARVLGYVSSVYGTRPEIAVKADIDSWLSIYSDELIDGLFIDEQPWTVTADHIALYQRYREYAHARNLYPVVTNPGTNQQGQWYEDKTLDICVIHENSTWPDPVAMEGNFVGGHVDYPYYENAALIYGQTSVDPALVKTLSKWVKWIYITDDVLSPNPWDSLSNLLTDTFKALSSAVPAGGTTGQVLTKSSNNNYDATWAAPSVTSSVTMSGDVTGNSGSNTVTKLQGSAVSASAPSSNQALVWSGSAWAPTTQPYDLTMFVPDKPTNAMLAARIIAVRAFTLPASLTGSVASAVTASTGTAVFTLNKNGVSIGTITFTSSTTGVFSFASQVSFAAGDILTLVSPSTADTTLADISISLMGSR